MPTRFSARNCRNGPGFSTLALARETAATLRGLASEMEATNAAPRLEDLERRLTVLEEKLFAALLAGTAGRRHRDGACRGRSRAGPYRRKMPAAQIDQLQKQYIHKRLLEKYGLPRLSLFYM